MKYLKLLLLFFPQENFPQYKDDSPVGQFSAKLIKDNEISLKKFNDHNIHLFYLSKNQKHFDSEGIIYLPTVMLFYNGETILKIESGVTLKLPEDTEKQLNNAIDKILEDKF